MSEAEEIRARIEPVLRNQGVFLVEAVLRGRRNQQVLEVFIDSEGQVTAETCAVVSREISSVLDRLDLIPRSYTLVVSSPGVDRPLRFPAQYRKNIGRKLQVIVRDAAKTKTVRGILQSCGEAAIALAIDEENIVSVAFDDIVEVRVTLPW